MHDTLAGAVDSFFVASSHDPLDATPEKINKSDDAGGAQEKIDGGGQQLGRAEIVEGVIGGGGIGDVDVGGGEELHKIYGWGMLKVLMEMPNTASIINRRAKTEKVMMMPIKALVRRRWAFCTISLSPPEVM